MKIQFNLDDLPLNKTLKLHMLIVTVIVRSVFEEYRKYYSQFF